MSWTFSQDLPVYVQLIRHIRADILSGRYPADSSFPSVRQLAQTAAVNPNTMQRALGELEREGLLITRGTTGRFVTGDMDVLAAARTRATQDTLADMLATAKSAGISKAEILQFFEEQEEWTT